MKRLQGWLGTALACLGAVMVGCAPIQPFYLGSDGDLSHYLDRATDIEHPDVDVPHLSEVENVSPPLTLANFEEREQWHVSLEEAIQIALSNSKTIRLIRVQGPIFNRNAIPNITVLSPTSVSTYSPAIVETSPLGGVEAALSEFDASVTSGITWQKNDQARNVVLNPVNNAFFQPFLDQETALFNAGIAKRTAHGTQFSVTNTTIYDQNNSPTRAEPSDWDTQFTAEARQPFLRGAGTQFGRIYGALPFNGYAGQQAHGVMIARTNYDITLADFEKQVWDLISDVEKTYWGLTFAYRNLDAFKRARDAALADWRRKEANLSGGRASKQDEAASRQLYYEFRSNAENALVQLFTVESRLRYLMGLAATDGRIIRPSTEPTTGQVAFDWNTIHSEALVRNVILRRQKWLIKQKELELIASRNLALPSLDGVAKYRWRGLGDDLLDPNGFGIENGVIAGTDAFSTLTNGDYQEWELGLQFAMNIGFRRELSAIRNAQLQLAQERAGMEDAELGVSHLLSDSVRDAQSNYVLMETFFNLLLAAREEVDLLDKVREQQAEGTTQSTDPERYGQAQRRLAAAEVGYHQAVYSYNESLLDVHYHKGSLLEYNSVSLAEGPWPGKAYFDAHKRARERDAGLYLDYGFTRPNVVSRGPYDQAQGAGTVEGGEGEVISTVTGEGETILPMTEGAVDGVIEVAPGETPNLLPDSASSELPSPRGGRRVGRVHFLESSSSGSDATHTHTAAAQSAQRHPQRKKPQR